VRALVVVDEGCAAVALRALTMAVEVRSSIVCVAAVSQVPRWQTWLAPMSGLTTRACLVEDATHRADRAATDIARALVEARVERRVVTGWRDVIALIERTYFDVVVLGRPPARRSCLRRLVEASARGRTAPSVVVGA
jgi:hypothetical protein